MVDNNWRVREAALHGLASVSEHVAAEEQPSIQRIFAAASAIPFSPYPLGRALIKFFGLYSSISVFAYSVLYFFPTKRNDKSEIWQVAKERECFSGNSYPGLLACPGQHAPRFLCCIRLKKYPFVRIFIGLSCLF